MITKPTMRNGRLLPRLPSVASGRLSIGTSARVRGEGGRSGECGATPSPRGPGVRTDAISIGSLRFRLAVRHRTAVYLEKKEQRQEDENHHAEEEKELFVSAHGGFARHDGIQVVERPRSRGRRKGARHVRLQQGEPLGCERVGHSEVRGKPGARDHLVPKEYGREQGEPHGAAGL